MNTPYKCPICGCEINSIPYLCNECGFEIRLLPDLSPKEVIDYEDRRIRLMKAVYKKYKELIQEKDDKIHQISSELSIASRNIEQLKSDLVHLDDAKGTSEKLNLSLRSKIKELEASLEEKDNQDNYIEPTAYLVQFENGEAQYVYPIFEGEKSYGTALSSEYHQHINNGNLEDTHFSIMVRIETKNGRRRARFEVIPKDGKISVNNPYGVTNESTTIEKNDSIYAGDFKFTLMSNKNFK